LLDRESRASDWANDRAGGGLTVELAGTYTLPALTVGTFGAATTLKIDTRTLNLSTYTQGASSTLVTTLAGDGTYGRIDATGTAKIAGVVAIVLAGTYQPAVGTSFTIATAPTVSGTFRLLISPVGETFAPTYAPLTAAVTRAA
jgi:hypothetical protein